MTMRMRRTSPERWSVRIERGAKRIRAYLGGELVADTTRPLLVWEKPAYPTYYFPAADVRVGLLTTDEDGAQSPRRDDGIPYTVIAGGKQARRAALRFEGSSREELRDTIRLEWAAMDAWFEEDDQVFTHPRDPYTRIDILSSSRSVRVEADGVVIAETTKPTLLFETGLPTRYYIPRTHVRIEMLAISDTVTHCPYKGEAEHWSLRLGEGLLDVAWSYPAPLPESARIAGLLAFYPAKVELYVDGVRQA